MKEDTAQSASGFQLHAQARLQAFHLDVDHVSEVLHHGARVDGPKGHHSYVWEVRPDLAERALREIGFSEVRTNPGAEPGEVATYRKGEWGAWVNRRDVRIGPIKDN